MLSLHIRTFDGLWYRDGVPMGQTGHDLRFDVFLYIRPFFSFNWRTRGKQSAQISWFDVRDDTAFLNIVEVVND